MEGALGHLGKDTDHWVDALVLFQLGVVEHVEAVGCEGSAEKRVDDVNLQDYVDKVCNFEQSEIIEILLVAEHVPLQVLGDTGGFVPLLGAGEKRLSKFVGELAQQFRLATLPEKVRRVEKGRLEEEDEVDPLVVLVVDALLVLVVLVDTRMRNLFRRRRRLV